MSIDTAALLAAAELVDDLDAQRDREAEAFALGFRLGYGHGRDVGYGRAYAEQEQEWAAFARNIRAQREYAPGSELMRRRYPPDGDIQRWIRDGPYPPGRDPFTGHPTSTGDAA